MNFNTWKRSVTRIKPAKWRCKFKIYFAKLYIDDYTVNAARKTVEYTSKRAVLTILLVTPQQQQKNQGLKRFSQVQVRQRITIKVKMELLFFMNYIFPNILEDILKVIRAIYIDSHYDIQ